MRYERKYKIEHLALPLVEQSIRLHPAGFRKIYPNRQVNNVYFDTPDWTTFKENVMGIAERKKFRVRWYGEKLNVVEQPVFEIKIKNNLLGDKISEALPPFVLSNLDAVTKKIQTHTQSFTPFLPVLLNSYQRSYLGTSDGKFRITIDSKMQFFSLFNGNKFNGYQLEDEGVVVELKYEAAYDEETDSITQHLPFRLTKSSKYVTGVLMR